VGEPDENLRSSGARPRRPPLAGILALAGLALLGSWATTRPQEVGFSTAPSTPHAGTASSPPEQTVATEPAGTVGRRSAALPVAADVAVPQRVRLPGLQVDAPVVPVGVDDHGQVAVPADGTVVGWYRWSPAAGSAAGNTVLTGHVDTRRDGPGALFDLTDVRPGHTVAVELSDGSVVPYEVVALRDYDKADLPVDELFDRTGPARLLLITCGGEFDERTRRYADNVVVTAVPAP
jgi:hypothetical protein